jgi:peptidoglycan/LPS O-acetylase OafA/YrhL
MKTGRIAPLDSLRGLAALIVVFHHCLVTFPPFWEVYQHPVKPGLYRLLGNTPLHLLWDGPEFVLVFFTLSGFVLSLPFWGDRPLSYKQFVIRRVLRIYPPYLAAVTIGMISMSLLSHGPLTGLSDWTTQFWSHPLDWRTIGDHVFLMASAGDNYIDTPVWSLVVEMHASLLFPLMILALERSEIATLAGVLVLAFVGDWAGMQDPGNHIHPFLTSFATTARYLWLFAVGALMARHRQALTTATARVPVLLQMLFLATALIALNCFWQFGADETWRFVQQIGAIALVASAAYMVWFQRLLDIAPLRWLGKISYSLYLIHFVVLFTVLYAFRSEVTLPRLIIAVPLLSIGAAALLYRFVEVPSIAWGHRASDARGRRLTSRISEAVDTPPP